MNNNKKNKHNGSSFLYVLIALSFITFTCTNLLFFTIERFEIFKLNNFGDNKFDKEKLIKLEKISALNLFEKNTEIYKYFSISVVEEENKSKTNQYIFMCENSNKVSVGGYKVVKIFINNKEIENNCIGRINGKINALIKYEKNLFNNIFVSYEELLKIETLKSVDDIHIKVLKSEVSIDEKI